MRVHLYAQCWNDEHLLPFFFRHYDRIVDRYVLFDDGSTDRTMEILQNHPKVDVRRFVRSFPESFVKSEQALSNACWKESRGTADWVIVTDVDEHLMHGDLRDYLQICTSNRVTLVPALGFQMISDDVPEDGDVLCERFTVGAPWRKMMKASIFDPNRIEESNFTTGRHTSMPLGYVRVPLRDEVLLLHYKYLGLERTYVRNRMLKSGLGAEDIEKNWGARYSWSLDDLKEDWENAKRLAIDVAEIRGNPAFRYPVEPWWNAYRNGLTVTSLV